jgi:hypothetical protein
MKRLVLLAAVIASTKPLSLRPVEPEFSGDRIKAHVTFWWVHLFLARRSRGSTVHSMGLL